MLSVLLLHFMRSLALSFLRHDLIRTRARLANFLLRHMIELNHVTRLLSGGALRGAWTQDAFFICLLSPHALFLCPF